MVLFFFFDSITNLKVLAAAAAMIVNFRISYVVRCHQRLTECVARGGNRLFPRIRIGIASDVCDYKRKTGPCGRSVPFWPVP